MKLCTRCHHAEAEWDFGEEAYCQLCWEAHCAETWNWYLHPISSEGLPEREQESK